VQLDPIKPMLKLPGTKRSRLKCDESLSESAFKFKLRRYTKEAASFRAFKGHLPADHPEATAALSARPPHDGETLRVRWPPGNPVGRCRLTLSNPS
jgi:hypothetical protein